MVDDAAKLVGRVAVITGAGHGLGAATAEVLAAHGACVVVNDVEKVRSASVATKVTELGGQGLGVSGDVSNPADVKSLMNSAREAFGPIDILVNNAARFCNKPFNEHTVEDWDSVFSVNVRGVFLCCRAVVDEMTERKRGSIVNIASIAAFHTTVKHVAYAASKAAVVSMTRDLAAEVGESGVRVNAVAPGPIDTQGYMSDTSLQTVVPGSNKGGTLLNRRGLPIDIAQAVAFLVSDEAEWITGETLPVAGGSDLKVHY